MNTIVTIFASLIIMLLVVNELIPLLTGTMEIVDEPVPGVDSKIKFDALVGSAFTLNTYVYMSAMPRDANGRLAWVGVAPLEKSRAMSFFKKSVGKIFVKSLVEIHYLEKHRFECVSGCKSLVTCVSVGESIYGADAKSYTDDEIEAILGDETIVGECLRVADYIMRRNQYLSKQAEITSGTLTDGWTEEPP